MPGKSVPQETHWGDILDNPPGIFLVPAVFANAINLKGVPGGQVVVGEANLLLEFVDFGRKELYRTPTFGTDHVMVAAAVVLMFVASDSIVKSDFAGQAAIDEQFQSTVDGSESDARIFFSDQAMKLVEGKMLAGFEEGAQNSIALRRVFQANAFEMAVQNILRLANHLARDTRLIIDPLLQHAREFEAGGHASSRTPIPE
jgi:hypothetical protein